MFFSGYEKSSVFYHFVLSISPPSQTRLKETSLLKLQENQNPSLIPSQNTHISNTSSSSSSSNHNGLPRPSPPATPAPVTRSEPSNTYPTTFVQADSSSFKQVVQMLTGSSETAKHAVAVSSRPDPSKNPIPPIKTGSRKAKASKLYERRNSLKNFKIIPLIPGLLNHLGYSGSTRKPGTPEILSPSMLNFPSLTLSPVTPLIPDPFNRCRHSGFSPSVDIDMEAENKAIAHKGFYLHPSPSNTPRDSEPRLLPLFPVPSSNSS